MKTCLECWRLGGIVTPKSRRFLPFTHIFPFLFVPSPSVHTSSPSTPLTGFLSSLLAPGPFHIPAMVVFLSIGNPGAEFFLGSSAWPRRTLCNRSQPLRMALLQASCSAHAQHCWSSSCACHLRAASVGALAIWLTTWGLCQSPAH